jgi:hypothetical protein
LERGRSEQGLWTVVARFLGATNVLLMILTAYMYFHYAGTRPTVPEDKIGRIYPLNVHGRVIYLVRQEQLGLYALEGVTVSCILSFGLVVQLKLKRS